jgi:UDP-glucuronate 4-epimerase
VGGESLRILVTGVAGFIGYHAAARLLAEGEKVAGIDNLNPYYDTRLKQARLARLADDPNFEFMRVDIADRGAMEALFERATPELVVHLAAQVGVRNSIQNPHAYVEANLTGFLHVLEGARRARVRHLIYASSSSVYGGDAKAPFSVKERADRPISFYAATKRANELMAHCYTHLFDLPSTGLRFFTVYGPWGRPDMAPFKFAAAILADKPIEIYNYGRMQRDFTYIDDIVEGIWRLVTRAPEGYRLFNIGNHRAVELMEFIGALEGALGRTARHRFLPLQDGDMLSTCAEVEDFCEFTGFRPRTPVREGVEKFVAWYREYYRIVGHEHGANGRPYHVFHAS